MQGVSNSKTMNEHSTISNDASQHSEERDLLDRIASQEREALTELYRRYYGRLFKFVYRMTGSHSASDELVNDIMLIVWKGASSFRGDSKVSTWIFGIAYRQSLKRLSKKQLSVAADSDPDSLAAGDGRNLEREDWVRFGLDALPPAQRLTICLVFYVGLSYDEVAKATGCPVNTVKTRMFHARKKMKERLEESANAEHMGRGYQ